MMYKLLLLIKYLQFDWEYRLDNALDGRITLAVDCTRCPIERPKGSAAKAKQFWSFKDKYYALKYELGVSLGDATRIVYLSPAYRGGFADVNIAQAQLLPILSPEEYVVMDKGYQLDAEPRFLTPFKEFVNNPLSEEQLEFNRLIHVNRQIVERVNKRVKHFQAFNTQWRHSIDFHEICFSVACKLTNIFLEFEPMNKV
jgi:hypothetical protein